MTDTELTAIEARANASTPGPWRFGSQYDDDVCADAAAIAVWTNEDEGAVADMPSAMLKSGDLSFVIHARADIPRLIAALRKERREKEHLRRALELASTWLANAALGVPVGEYVDTSGMHGPTPEDIAQAALDATKEAPCPKN